MTAVLGVRATPTSSLPSDQLRSGKMFQKREVRMNKEDLIFDMNRE
jgi:hypothetical protein